MPHSEINWKVFEFQEVVSQGLVVLLWGHCAVLFGPKKRLVLS